MLVCILVCFEAEGNGSPQEHRGWPAWSGKRESVWEGRVGAPGGASQGGLASPPRVGPTSMGFPITNGDAWSWELLVGPGRAPR